MEERFHDLAPPSIFLNYIQRKKSGVVLGRSLAEHCSKKRTGRVGNYSGKCSWSSSAASDQTALMFDDGSAPANPVGAL